VLYELIRRARRRHLLNLGLRFGVQAGCVGVAGFSILLILGTELLDWRWAAFAFAAGLAAILRGLRTKLPSGYGTAQGIDRTLGLQDTLSTAFFYDRVQPARPVSEPVRAAQHAAAEQVARTVSPRSAVPLRAPKSLYAMAALTLVASSLFALRYGISRRLDLRPPITRIALDVFHLGPREEAARRDAKTRRAREVLKELGLPTGDPIDQKQGEGNQPASAAEDRDGVEPRQTARNTPSGTQRLNVEDSSSRQGKEPGSPASNTESGDPERSNAASPNQQTGHNERADESAQGGNSLAEKFRDAMERLLSRLKPQPGSGGSRQAAANTPGRSEQARSKPGPSGQPTAEQAADEMNANSNGDTQGGQQASGAGKPKQGGSGQQSAGENPQPSKEGNSGIGKEDGNKAVREAEQLAAMGKISEIVGKRSQNLTGEVMVEVASGSQQLRTGWSQQNAAHSEAGGEIHRDEVPLAYQRYVEQYFEQIRKSPAKKP
jgi:hypothetical protein